MDSTEILLHEIREDVREIKGDLKPLIVAALPRRVTSLEDSRKWASRTLIGLLGTNVFGLGFALWKLL